MIYSDTQNAFMYNVCVCECVRAHTYALRLPCTVRIIGPSGTVARRRRLNGTGNGAGALSAHRIRAAARPTDLRQRQRPTGRQTERPATGKWTDRSHGIYGIYLSCCGCGGGARTRRLRRLHHQAVARATVADRLEALRAADPRAHLARPGVDALRRLRPDDALRTRAVVVAGGAAQALGGDLDVDTRWGER